MRYLSERKRGTRRRFAPAGMEILETRALLATVTVNASQVVQPVNTQLSGVNIGWWDTLLNTTQTESMVQAAGLTSFRFPGGSWSDTLHFNVPIKFQTDYGLVDASYASMAQFIASVDGQGIVSLDYGSGSPQEAAALLSYLDAPTTSDVPIGYGEEWSTSSNSWVQVNWQNSGYWASLRASTPITPDDGLNFLRIGRAAPFGFQYFEVGNEEYGSWETDHHGQGGDTGKPHDPATYVAFAKSFAGYASQIDPAISVGYDVGGPYSYNNWAGNILAVSAGQGFKPGFLSDHNYVQTPGSESDSNLLQDTFSDPNSIYDWAVRGAAYESLLTHYYGAAGATVQLLGTEFNSVNANPGKQTTSLVNGLSVADSLGVLLDSPYVGANVWDLRDGWTAANNNSSSLYGWREGGDFGLIGRQSPNPSPPASGSYVPYPTYFAEQLGSKIIQAGGEVVQASSNDADLSAYAVLESNGHLDLLVINKSASGALTGNFDLTGFTPATSAQVWQYGEAQDTAQSQTTDGDSALANFAVTLPVSGSTFSLSFPAYSMTVLDLTPSTSIPIPGATASFLKSDATTQGSWAGTYGVQGYDIVSGPTSLPSGDTVTPSGQLTHTYTTTSSDPRALQVPGSSNRVAAVWYSATNFTVDVNLGDGQTHNLELYFDDWDNRARAEQVQISDAGTGKVLDTETISSFSNGLYLDWKVSGNLLITITNQGPANAVLNGVFLDSTAPPPPPTSTANFIKSDTTTQGSWAGTYGAQGYDIVSGPTSLPSGDTVTPSGQLTHTYTTTSSDPRALQVPGSSNRVAAVWYSATNFTVDVNLADGQTHNLELYFDDWDNRARAEQVQISDAGTGKVLDTESVSSFSAGEYLNWTVSGNLVITFTNVGPANAVLSGVFIDPPASASATSFIKSDTTTQGSGIGSNDSQGDDIVSGPTSLRSYATFTPSGESLLSLDATTGTFQDPTDGSKVRVVRMSFRRIRYAGGTGKDVASSLRQDSGRDAN